MTRTVKIGLILIPVLLVVLALAEVIRDATRQSASGGHPSFSATDLDGKTWDLAELRGKQPVLLAFFATWCGPCRMELPQLAKLQQKYGDRGFKVLMLTPEPAETVRKYPELTGTHLTFLTDTTAIHAAYRVSSLPHTVLFDRAGKVLLDQEGFDPAGEPALDQAVGTACSGG